MDSKNKLKVATLGGVAAITIGLALSPVGAQAAKAIDGSRLISGSVGMGKLSDGVQDKINNAQGKDGKDGKDGADGETGPAGPAGADGKDGAQGPAGPAGTPGSNGAQGHAGRDGLDDAIYRVLTYTNGGGGSATVACDDDPAISQTYTAIAGGVQGGTAATQDDGFAVNSSFPGRMNWGTGEPLANRLDGWIVLGNGQWTETLTVWALCVPTISIEVVADTIDN
jgi:hypothetical protein